MTSEIEALGDVTTGVLVARAVDPSHGDEDAAGSGVCLNCGTALAGAYCHACGQVGRPHRTIASFMHDLLHGVFHFEGKFWETLPMLLIKPGELTRRYVDGERAKFVSPLAMFLFCTFLMFAVVGNLAGTTNASGIDPNIPEITAQSRVEIDQEAAKQTSALAALRKQISELEKSSGDTAVLESQVAAVEKNIEGLRIARNVVASVSGDVADEGVSGKKPFLVIEGLETGWPALNHGIQSANANPDLFLYRLQTSAYKYGWLLIPISTPMVWLLFFWKRKYKAYDHLVFVTFSLTFMLLLGAVLVVAGAVGLPAVVIVPAALIIPPIHMYKQVRGAYASSWIMALIRTSILVFFSFIALGIYASILLALGVAH